VFACANIVRGIDAPAPITIASLRRLFMCLARHAAIMRASGEPGRWVTYAKGSGLAPGVNLRLTANPGGLVLAALSR